jgi:hypothetical protein
LSKRAVVTYTCNACKARTGKDVAGERIVVGDRVFDLCIKDRKVIDAYMKFDREYGASVQQAEREARKVAELEARTITERRAVTPTRSTGGSERPERSKCGLCWDQGETKEVAYNTRAYHALRYHDLKASEIDWR